MAGATCPPANTVARQGCGPAAPGLLNFPEKPKCRIWRRNLLVHQYKHLIQNYKNTILRNIRQNPHLFPRFSLQVASLRPPASHKCPSCSISDCEKGLPEKGRDRSFHPKFADAALCLRSNVTCSRLPRPHFLALNQTWPCPSLQENSLFSLQAPRIHCCKKLLFSISICLKEGSKSSLLTPNID